MIGLVPAPNGVGIFFNEKPLQLPGLQTKIYGRGTRLGKILIEPIRKQTLISLFQ
jgi:hypothetical protein